MKEGVYGKYFKRLIDIILSLIGMIILLPVLFVISILIKLKLGSPIIFKQERPGLNEEIFTMYKFRTMTDERDENGELLSDSDRLTRFGKFLRLTSLDELPEIYNILKGDMAIIGPRPLLIEYLPYYTEKERKRHSIRPGLTGLAQIGGRNNLKWDDRLKTDIEYVENLSFILDIKIFILTIIKTIRREDVVENPDLGGGDLVEIRSQRNIKN